jgi:parallel beta-helix repeat protein
VKTSCSSWNALWILLLALCFSLCGTSVAQNQYFVATTGSDSNDGSQAHPWLTINHADAALSVGSPGSCTATSGWVSAFGIGACVHVASGNYPAITTNKSGTANAHIMYVSDTQYGANIIGPGGAMWAANGLYIDVVGFEFDGSGSTANANGLIFYGGHGTALRNKFHDTAKAGNTTQNAVLEGNINSPCPAANKYIGNLIYHNNGGAGVSAQNAGSADAGISMVCGDIAQNNIVLDHGGGFCIQVSHNSDHNVVTNNVVANCDRGGIFINSGTGHTITNNIVANTGISIGANVATWGIRDSNGCGTGTIYNNNLLYGNLPANYSFACGTQANPPAGAQTGSNSTTFANYTGTGAGDYHPKADSMAINNGSTACATSNCVAATDFVGAIRPLTSAFDLGSYQSSATSATGLPAAPTGLTASVQ